VVFINFQNKTVDSKKGGKGGKFMQGTGKLGDIIRVIFKTSMVFPDYLPIPTTTH